MSNQIKCWSFEEATAILNQPFFDLLYQAHKTHRDSFDHNTVQISTLFSIKTGSCPENCKYCSQSAHYNTNIQKEPLAELENVIKAAKNAKANGATRFCMGAAWRSPTSRDIKKALEMIKEVKNLGLETCATFGLLNDEQASQLKEAGLDYYNHNIDTSEEFYDKIITTRTFQDRLETIKCVGNAGINICCGGIIGMGESIKDRINMLIVIANMHPQPKSVPINLLVKIPGTPLENATELEKFDFIRLIALARIMLPNSYVRLSAGRESMSEELQALCFFAGANSIFYGDKLLTANNKEPSSDDALFTKLGLKKAINS